MYPPKGVRTSLLTFPFIKRSYFESLRYVCPSSYPPNLAGLSPYFLPTYLCSDLFCAEICHWKLVFLSGDVGVLTFYSAQSASVQTYFVLVCYHCFEPLAF